MAFHRLCGVIVHQNQRLSHQHNFFQLKQGAVPVHRLRMRLRAELFAYVGFSMDGQRHCERDAQSSPAFFATKMKQGHFGSDLKSNSRMRGAFDQLQSTGVRLQHRVSRVLKRMNRRTEVTSTNLAHTAPYCLPTSPGTMAERYHKIAFCNSTLVLPPMFPSHLLPSLETIVIPLANDLFRLGTLETPQKRPSSALQPEWTQRGQPTFRPIQPPAPPGHGPLSPVLSYTSDGTCCSWHRLSQSSVPTGAFVSICSGLGRFSPNRFPRR